MSLNNFGIVKSGKLFRFAQPKTQADFDIIKALGIDYLLKLSNEEEFSLSSEVDLFKGFKGENRIVGYINIPMWATTVSKLKEAALRIHGVNIETVSCIGVHCYHGRDRTGVVIAAWRMLYDNFTLAQALEEFHQYNTNFITDLGDFEILRAVRELAKELGK